MKQPTSYKIVSMAQYLSWPKIIIAVVVLFLASAFGVLSEAAIVVVAAIIWLLVSGNKPEPMEWVISNGTVLFQTYQRGRAPKHTEIRLAEVARFKYIDGDKGARWHGAATIKLTLDSGEKYRFYFYDTREDGAAFYQDFLEALNRENNQFVTD